MFELGQEDFGASNRMDDIRIPIITHFSCMSFCRKKEGPGYVLERLLELLRIAF